MLRVPPIASAAVGALLLAGLGPAAALAQPAPTPQRTAEPAPTQPPAGSAPARSPEVYYRNCDAARAAGAAPIYRGQPGYRPELDRDRDGVACEPYRGRR